VALAVYGAMERAAGRRAARREFVREHAGQAFLVACCVVAVVLAWAAEGGGNNLPGVFSTLTAVGR